MIRHNPAYRVITFLLWYNIWFTTPTDWGNWLVMLFLGVIPCFFVTLYFVDKHFKKYVQAINKRQNQKQEQEQEENNQFAKDVIEIVPLIPKMILYKLLPFLTRLPIIEDHFLNTLQHHRYRDIRTLCNVIEGIKSKSEVHVIMVDPDQYHVTFDIIWKKPVTVKKVKARLNRDLKQYFGHMPEGIEYRLKRSGGQVLIPSELVNKSN